MRFACWILKATKTHSQYVILIAFHSNYDCTNAPQCYVIRALSVLVMFTVVECSAIYTFDG